MNSNFHQSQVQRHQQEIARLQRDKGRETERIANLSRQANSASQALARASNTSSASSCLREIQRYQDELVRAQKTLADIEDKVAREHARLIDAQTQLSRELDREARDRQRQDERRAREHEQRMRHITRTLSTHDTLHRDTASAIQRLSQLPERITVLFMAANPLDQVQLRLDEEVRTIVEMIRKSQHRDAVKLESCWAVRPLDVLQAINEHRPRIVHFSGHGSDQDEIVFQDHNGDTKLVSKEAIVQTMAAASGDIRLVFFNTCYSRNQAEAVVTHVDAAIGMNTTIGDQAARVFAAQFYSAIGFGLSVKRAFTQAQAALMLEGIPEHDTPELFVADAVDPNRLLLVKPLDDDHEVGCALLP